MGHAWIYKGGGRDFKFCHKLFLKGSSGNQYFLVQLKRTFIPYFIPYPSNDQPFSYRLKYKEFLKGVLCYEGVGGGEILRVAKLTAQWPCVGGG